MPSRAVKLEGREEKRGGSLIGLRKAENVMMELLEGTFESVT